ncbi:MAG: NACHT domain-containing protein [Balneolaceae bacterium]|nr:NACHT domain-containing protein [Balneolaceae bacterium]MDR9408127.1 NACHT domain-containing protein [Balneolaceae bacterium]
MIPELVLSKVLELSIEKGTKLLKQSDFRLASSQKEIEESLNQHLKTVKNWAREISFKDASQAKILPNIYIDLDLSVYPKKTLLEGFEPNETVNFKDIPLNKHTIILGQPGAGKTTSLKYLCHSMIFEEKGIFENHEYNYPVLLKFRELDYFDSRNFLLDNLLKIFGISLKYERPNTKTEEDVSPEQYKSIAYKYVLQFIDSQNLVLILDGFDELPSNEIKEYAIKDIRLLASSMDSSLLILSSRSSDFSYHIDGTNEFEIAPLNNKQIREFSRKWLGSKKDGVKFFKKIKKSPFYDTTIRPLTIAHLCAIYERRGDIPKKPKTVYSKLINLLLEEWDLQRSVKRKSEYANFEVDRKSEFLSALSFELTTHYKKNIFSSSELQRIYHRINPEFDLPSHESRNVVKELETHNGLIMRTGYDQFEFAHKSLQEYLTANYIVKLPELPKDLSLIKSIPNELAIAITISSNPSMYFIKFTNEYILAPKSGMDESFVTTFINRLLLEKPDFNRTPELVFTVLKLFEYYHTQIENLVNSKDYPNKLKLAQSLGDFCSTLINKSENFIDIIKNNYTNTSVNDDFFKYRKIHQCEGPKTVYIPKSK